MNVRRAFHFEEKAGHAVRALPLPVCWAVWIGASATLWAIILELI